MDTVLGRRDSKAVLIWRNVASEEGYGRQSWNHTSHCWHPPESESDDSANHQPGMRMTKTPGARGSRGPATAYFLPCPSSGSQSQRQSRDLVENGWAGEHAYLPRWGEGSRSVPARAVRRVTWPQWGQFFQLQEDAEIWIFIWKFPMYRFWQPIQNTKKKNSAGLPWWSSG